MSEKKGISFWHPASLICTVFGVGKIPFAPGTWGSLAGTLLIIFSPLFYSLTAVIALCLILLLLGIYCSDIYERKTGQHDLGEIVIDEVVGVIIATAISHFIILHTRGNFLAGNVVYDNLEIAVMGLGINIILSFITFRFFDIIKPWPASWADKNVKGGLGVMLDDVLAAIYAGLASALILSFL